MILNAEDKYILELQMEGQTFIRYKKSLRVTWADKLGNLGGTLGLFCGFSILTFFGTIFNYFKRFKQHIHN